LEFVDRQASSLARRARKLAAEHHRVAWLLRTRSGQVQRDVHQARLVPADSVFQGFRKMVRDLARSAGKEIDFQATGLDVCVDRMVLQELKDPIMHVLRNCVTHGIESPAERQQQGKPPSGCVALCLEIAGGRLAVTIDDDGRGIDVAEIRAQAIERGLWTPSAAAHSSIEETLAVVFEPGFSTQQAVTELAGAWAYRSFMMQSCNCRAR
jgi:two-component system chemotaxis sensor kinase CheA